MLCAYVATSSLPKAMPIGMQNRKGKSPFFVPLLSWDRNLIIMKKTLAGRSTNDKLRSEFATERIKVIAVKGRITSRS